MKPNIAYNCTRLCASGLSLTLLVIGLLAPGLPTVAIAEDEVNLYLPWLATAQPDLSGQIWYNSLPVSGVEVTLWRRNTRSNEPSRREATAVSDQLGIYHFWNPPDLPPNDVFSATYDNGIGTNPVVKGWARTCNTRELSGVDSERGAYLGDLNIADIELATPLANTKQRLPLQFTWLPSNGRNGRYQMYLYQPGLPNGPVFVTGYLDAGVTTYTLGQLPGGFAYNTAYAWGMNYRDDQEFCVSQFENRITFAKR